MGGTPVLSQTQSIVAYRRGLVTVLNFLLVQHKDIRSIEEIPELRILCKTSVGQRKIESGCIVWPVIFGKAVESPGSRGRGGGRMNFDTLLSSICYAGKGSLQNTKEFIELVFCISQIDCSVLKVPDSCC